MELKELIIQESFNQNFIIDAAEFVEFCNDRGFYIDENHLEVLDKYGIIMPIIKLKENIIFGSSSELKELYSHDKVILDNEFICWKNFYIEEDGIRKQIIFVYYHPYQIYQMDRIIAIMLKNQIKWEELKENAEKFSKILRKDDKIIELLFLIQNRYLPRIRRFEMLYMYPDDNIDKLNRLQAGIIPQEIIDKLKITSRDVRLYREKISCHGLSIDPLEKWYDIVRCIKYDKRQELKCKALLSQYYYLMSDILALFLEELTGKNQPDIYSYCESMSSYSKLRYYGEEKKLDYCSRNNIERALYEYGISPKPRLILIVEGYTEEELIPIISDAFDISLSNLGIKLFNIRGVDRDIRELIVNFTTPYIGKIFDRNAILDSTKVFILLDKEGKGWIKKLIANPEGEINNITKDVLEIIKNKKINLNPSEIIIFKNQTIDYYFWEKNLEYDNFSDKELLTELKIYGNRHNKKLNLSANDIKKCIVDNKNLKKFIENKTNTSLNKTDFGRQLGRSIAREIGYRKNKFVDQRPIEKILYKIINFTIRK